MALKIITKKYSSTLFLKHFLPREINLVKGLQHENIIRYYHCILTNHRTIIVMDFAENGTLFDLLHKIKKFREFEARRYFSQLTAALKYCHRRKIAHRDLKLENLLLDKEFNLKLSDFGFSRKMLDSNATDTSNLSVTFCGSNAYACPELLKHLPYDPIKADIWAMGVILFAMVTGRFPFNEALPLKLLIKVNSVVIVPFIAYTHTTSRFQSTECGPHINTLTISDACKNLLMKLLASAEKRHTIEQIDRNPWLRIT